MVNLKLYKDDKIVIDKDGSILDNKYVFDNIIYDYVNNVLIREDDNFKYSLDFKSKLAEVTIKQNGFSLDLDLDISKNEMHDNSYEIVYMIESDEKHENKILISLK